MQKLRLAKPMLVALAACAASVAFNGAVFADDAQTQALKDQMRIMQQQMQDLQKQIDSLQKENDRYTQRVKSLQEPDPNTIEKEAREQLHYARPGEVVYVAPPPPHPPKPETNAVRK